MITHRWNALNPNAMVSSLPRPRDLSRRNPRGRTPPDRGARARPSPGSGRLGAFARAGAGRNRAFRARSLSILAMAAGCASGGRGEFASRAAKNDFSQGEPGRRDASATGGAIAAMRLSPLQFFQVISTDCRMSGGAYLGGTRGVKKKRQARPPPSSMGWAGMRRGAQRYSRRPLRAAVFGGRHRRPGRSHAGPPARANHPRLIFAPRTHSRNDHSPGRMSSPLASFFCSSLSAA